MLPSDCKPIRRSAALREFDASSLP